MSTTTAPPNRNAGVLVRQKMLEQMTDFMEDDAHERTQSGADHAERHQLYNEQHIRIFRHTGERKRGRAAAKLQRYLMRDHAREDGPETAPRSTSRPR